MTDPTWSPQHPAADGELAEFFRACGGRPQLQVESSDGDVFERQRFDRPFLLVGRSSGCDVRCRHPEVSFRHAYLQYLEGAVIAVDLNSRTGTFGRWGRFEVARLGVDDVFSVGPFKIRLIDGDGPLAAIHGQAAGESDRSEAGSGVLVPSGRIARNELALPGDSAFPQVYLELEDGGGDALRHVVRRSVTLVGGWPGCDLCLRSHSVSRVHCSLVLTRDGLWVVDLLGRDGVQVDGRSVPYGPLPDGCELRIGKYATTVRYTARTTAARATVERASVAGPGRNGGDSDTGGGRRRRRGRAGGVSEDLILSLVSHFASMQQQMYEQNQQQMTLMLQMFGSLHRSQQDLIRDDLDRVHELMREMQGLQRLLLLRDQGPEQSGLDQPPVAPTAPQPAEAKVPRRLDAAPPEPVPLTPPPPSHEVGAQAAVPAPAADGQHPGPPPVPVRRPAQEASAATGPSDPPADATIPGAPPGAGGEQAEAVAVPAAAGELDAERRARASRGEANDHAWLLQRMQALEKERHGRWKKIMRALGGG